MRSIGILAWRSTAAINSALVVTGLPRRASSDAAGSAAGAGAGPRAGVPPALASAAGGRVDAASGGSAGTGGKSRRRVSGSAGGDMRDGRAGAAGAGAVSPRAPGGVKSMSASVGKGLTAKVGRCCRCSGSAAEGGSCPLPAALMPGWKRVAGKVASSRGRWAGAAAVPVRSPGAIGSSDSGGRPPVSVARRGDAPLARAVAAASEDASVPRSGSGARRGRAPSASPVAGGAGARAADGPAAGTPSMTTPPTFNHS